MADAPVSRWLDWLPGSGQPHSVARLGATMIAVALVLKLLQCMLDVPSGWGVEDFLGWVEAGPDGPVNALVQIWQGSSRLPVAWVYLAADSVVFVPVYVAYAISLSLLLSNALSDDLEEAVSRSEQFVLAALGGPVLALLLIDLVENAVGLVRTGLVGSWLAAPVTVAAGVLLWRLPQLRTALRRLHWWVQVATLGAGLAIWLAAAFLVPGCAGEAANWLWRLGCGAHHAKVWLIGAVVCLMLLAVTSWLFGVRLQPKPNDSRARLRSAIWDIIVRSRYVLLALALVAALTITLDQGRDVLYAVASSAFRDGDQRLGFILGSAVVLAAAGIAVWLFVFTCWFWTRSVCLVRAARSSTEKAEDRKPGPQDLFASYWARVLGLAPALLLALLCAGVISDTVRSQGTSGTAWVGPVWVVLTFGIITVAFGVLFLHRRVQTEETYYYDCRTWREWVLNTGLVPDGPRRGKYHFGDHVSAYRLPLFLILAMLLCRAVDSYRPAAAEGQLIVDYLPTLSFAIILFEVSLWLCFFGWLSILEVHRSTPWVGVLIAAAGLFGALGWTGNHVVWPAIAGAFSKPWGLLRMLIFTTLLAGWLVLAYLWVMSLVRRNRAEQSDGAAAQPILRRIDWAPALGLAALMFGLLWAADRNASPRPVAAAELVANERPSLGKALANWLGELCGQRVRDDCTPAVPRESDGGIRVHFVSTEGGGIRAAAWTSFLLDELTSADPHFMARTFSMSGVSGGAVGLAAFRACLDEEPSRRGACIRRLAGSDLLSPLLSAWMFEDLFGRILPSRWCDTPACGFLSRGAWFEQAMETGTVKNSGGTYSSGLRGGLVRNSYEGRHQPYLLLNATWVETGERAIASDLRVGWEQFRGAKDQIDITGVNMPLGAAAHNAARFPFVNAIGVLEAPPRRCLDRLAEPKSPEAHQRLAENIQDRVTCGHLADGGYFDNSGAQTTIDILHALARCLNVLPHEGDALFYKECLTLDGPREEDQKGRKHRKWFSRYLVPQVLMIRNSVNPAAAREEVCPPSDDRAAPRARDVRVAELSTCTALTDKGYAPERPVCRQQVGFFIDLVGPALTVLNASGVGANGQLAEARQSQAVRALRLIFGGAAEGTRLAPTEVLDLMPDGVRYPLGWHLSGLAVGRMSAQAKECAQARTGRK